MQPTTTTDEALARLLQAQFDQEQRTPTSSPSSSTTPCLPSHPHLDAALQAVDDQEGWRLQACLDDEAFARLLGEEFDGGGGGGGGGGEEGEVDLGALFMCFDEQ
ncbi:hypothetical protein HDU67_004074, partial [Dinochytrium kinnereticum]